MFRNWKLFIITALIAFLACVGVIINKNMEQQLKYPLDPASKEIIFNEMKRMMPDAIMDIVWNKYFYFPLFFDSLDGWLDGGVGTPTINVGSGIGVTMTTSDTTNDTAFITRNPRIQEFISFDQHSRFRTGIHISNASIDDIEFSMAIGEGFNGSVKNHYGFRMEDGGILKGTSANGSLESEVTLVSSLTPQSNYILEAKFYPSNKVVFSVSDANSNKLIERGTINTNLPTGTLDTDAGGEDNVWIDFFLKTLADDAKTAIFSFFEYIQER